MTAKTQKMTMRRYYRLDEAARREWRVANGVDAYVTLMYPKARGYVYREMVAHFRASCTRTVNQ